MRNGHHISLIIPALNEELAIETVVCGLPAWIDDVVVADNASTDTTASIALANGARVVTTERRGYGSNCLGALATVTNTDVIVFMDGDASCDPLQLPLLIDPIVAGAADVVIGSRTLGTVEPGAMGNTQRFGNWLAPALIRLLWGAEVTDLGPFRAVRSESFAELSMKDRDFGWTVELQIKATIKGMRMIEVPVTCRRRIGQSKISGTWRGVFGAGTKILYTVLRYRFSRQRPR